MRAPSCDKRRPNSVTRPAGMSLRLMLDQVAGADTPRRVIIALGGSGRGAKNDRGHCAPIIGGASRQVNNAIPNSRLRSTRGERSRISMSRTAFRIMKNLGTLSKVENNYEEDVGRKVKVCYNPSDPNSSDFRFSDVYTSSGEKIVCGGTSR